MCLFVLFFHSLCWGGLNFGLLGFHLGIVLSGVWPGVGLRVCVGVHWLCMFHGFVFDVFLFKTCISNLHWELVNCACFDGTMA